MDKTVKNTIVVNTTGADFVFEKNYKLPLLKEVEAYIMQHKHLPGMQPAAEMQVNGVGVSELQTTMLQKLEEITLYMIEQNKQINELKKENEALKKQISNIIK